MTLVLPYESGFLMKLPALKLVHKLPLLVVAASILAAVVVSFVAIRAVERQGVSAAEEKLVAIRSAHASALNMYLTGIEQNLAVLARNRYLLQGFGEFISSYETLSGEDQARLRRAYMEDNPHPHGEKEKLDFAADGSQYSRIHGRFHDWFRYFIERRGYSDLFLISPAGDVVYTVEKESDFATNLLSGPWKDTGVARIFRDIAARPERDRQAFADLEIYGPSHGLPASFLAMPLHDEKDVFVGVVAIQMPGTRINGVLAATEGMGVSGDAYIVNANDLTMRSHGRFLEDGDFLSRKVSAEAVAAARAGKSGVHEVKNYRNQRVYSAYEALPFKGASWVLLVEIARDEILKPMHDTLRFVLVSMLVFLVFIVIGSLSIAHRMIQPMTKMTEGMQRLAKGDMTTKIEGVERTDEFGDMARAVQIFKDNAIKTKWMEEKQRLQEREKASQQKMVALAEMSGGMAHEINNALQPILGLSEVVREMAGESNPQILECVGIIHNSAVNARKIVSGILAFGRNQSETELFIEPARTSIAETVWFAAKVIPSSIVVETTGLEDGDNGETCYFRINRVKLMQIITNLFTNAAHAMNNKGKITVIYEQIGEADAEVLPTDVAPGRHIMLEVRDSGCGMDADTQASAFEPFFTTKKVGEGTGLGLSIVYGIIKEWGGTVKLESTPGVGTTVRIFLPVTAKNVKDHSASSLAAASLVSRG